MISKELFDTLCTDKVCAVIATLISIDGQGPARVGDSLLWANGKLIAGTIGGGNNEQQILNACSSLTGDNEVIEVSSFLPGTLPTCGGTLKIQLEKIDFGNPEQTEIWKEKLTRKNGDRLLLMGAGHVIREVAWLADRNGFQVTVIDSRLELMQEKYFPENCKLLLMQSSDFLSENIPEAQDFIVIAGPDHASDLSVLTEIIRSPAHYIGVMGSKKKITFFKEILQKKDLWQDAAERIYAPIGIPIPSRTPAEVAVSIVAELITGTCSILNKTVGILIEHYIQTAGLNNRLTATTNRTDFTSSTLRRSHSILLCFF